MQASGHERRTDTRRFCCGAKTTLLTRASTPCGLLRTARLQRRDCQHVMIFGVHVEIAAPARTQHTNDYFPLVNAVSKSLTRPASVKVSLTRSVDAAALRAFRSGISVSVRKFFSQSPTRVVTCAFIERPSASSAPASLRLIQVLRPPLGVESLLVV